jgi:hypothetical protein
MIAGIGSIKSLFDIRMSSRLEILNSFAKTIKQGIQYQGDPIIQKTKRILSLKHYTGKFLCEIKIKNTGPDMVRLVFIALLSVLVISCDSPLGLSTLDSEIQGEVIFLNPELKPDYVEAVRIVAAVQIPPQSLGDVIFTYSGVDLSSKRSVYRIPEIGRASCRERV